MRNISYTHFNYHCASALEVSYVTKCHDQVVRVSSYHPPYDQVALPLLVLYPMGSSSSSGDTRSALNWQCAFECLLKVALS